MDSNALSSLKLAAFPALCWIVFPVLAFAVLFSEPVKFELCNEERFRGTTHFSSLIIFLIKSFTLWELSSNWYQTLTLFILAGKHQ